MRSWGMDMESLLTDHLRVFLGEKKPALPRYMNDLSGAMGYITFTAIASVLLMLGVQLLRFVTRGYVAGDAPPRATWDELLRVDSHKIDLLYSFLGGGNAITLATLSMLYLGRCCSVGSSPVARRSRLERRAGSAWVFRNDARTADWSLWALLPEPSREAFLRAVTRRFGT
jgi:hypothetical protein